MVQQHVLEALADRALAVHVVWMPVLRSDSRDAALVARGIVSDERAIHYWDPERVLGKGYARVLPLPARSAELAWDAYLFFAPKCGELRAAPVPSAWAHQLGFDERYLGEGEGLLEDARALFGD